MWLKPTHISGNSPPWANSPFSEDGLYLMGTAQSNELMMPWCPGDAASLQQHPGADSYTRNRHSVTASPAMGWDNCFEEGQATGWPGRMISVRSLWPHRGHPAQSPYDNDAPLPGKAERDAAGWHSNMWGFLQVEQGGVSPIKGHSCKNFHSNMSGESRHGREATEKQLILRHSGIMNPIPCIKAILCSLSKPKKIKQRYSYKIH